MPPRGKHARRGQRGVSPQGRSKKSKNGVPPDDPRQRWRELAEEQEVAPETTGPIAAVTGEDAARRFAELRLEALEAARAMMPLPESVLTPVLPGGSNWVELGPTAIPNGQTYGGARVIVTGRVSDIAQHPTDASIIYVGTARGGVWKSEDAGVTWVPKSDNAESLAIGALALAKSNPQVLYAGTGEGDIFFYTTQFPLSSVNATYNGVGVLKSTNGGDSWTLQGSPTFTGACFFRIAVDPTEPDIAYAATNLGLYRTKNGGNTWTLLGGGLPAIGGSVLACTDVVIDPTDHTTAYAAFWGNGVYKTTNATAGSPTWTKLLGGFPTSDLSRIALAVSPTAPANVYALVANGSDGLRGFFTSTNGGTNWAAVAPAVGVVDVFGAYTLNVGVDISTPDIVYLSGVELYKAVRSAGTWTVTNVGGSIHPDNHAFASHPTAHSTIYAGNDGGIYKSTNGGTSWSDLINEGLAITQFEFIGQHPTSDAYVIGGTQDNGTEIFRNHPVFYHSDDGDGGMAGVDATDPRNVIHTYYNPSPQRSTQGGKFGTFSSIAAGLVGSSLFYPPYAYDDTNSQNLAFGTNRINLDTAQGTGGWPVNVTLPGISGRVSAVTYPNSNLIYVGTSSGQVYRLTRSGTTWTATLISAAPLPSRWIWDIAVKPGDLSTVILVVGGFGTGHVWRGSLAAGGMSATWTDISGTAPNRVPDVPVNSLQTDPLNPNHLYVGSDIGVFRTTNGGTIWELFSNGLPNTAVYDLRLHSPTRLLRAATHGRGLWERKLDTLALADVDVYLRDHGMSTGRIIPTPAPVVATLEDPRQHVALGDNLWWWMCADVKVDAPSPITHTYQLAVSAVDYLAFETKLTHRNPQRGRLNRVYVHVSNRGIETAGSVTVKILYADASPGLPNLPANFWTAFPGDGTTTVWKPIGTAKTIANLSPKRPQVLEWDWTPPATAATHSCLLVVVDPAQDPIPAANKVLNVGTLVTNEKRVGLKNLHVVDAPPSPWWFDLIVYARLGDLLRLAPGGAGWAIGVLLPPTVAQRARLDGLKEATLSKAQLEALQTFLGRKPKVAETKPFFTLSDSRKGATIENLPAASKGFPLLLFCQPRTNATKTSLTVLQQRGKRVLGGNTFVLRRVAKDGTPLDEEEGTG
jgi:photosystem II stability/assembly factor-like uncharacterized protein